MEVKGKWELEATVIREAEEWDETLDRHRLTSRPTVVWKVKM